MRNIGFWTIVAGFAAALPCYLLASESTSQRRPNVIIILCDDLGYGDVSCYGHGKFTTPQIDRLAASGARLTQFHTPYPYCAATRISLQTGRFPFRTGFVWNPTPDGNVNDIGIPNSELTLGQLLREAGYATGYLGKWHLGHKPEFYPTRHGYEEYFGILYSNDTRPVQLFENEQRVEYPVVQATLTKRYTERAVRFMERHRATPFFLMLAHAMPHKPLAASEAFYGKSGRGLYGDVVGELDWSVGQIVDALDRLGLADQTLLWFTSDNGPFYGGSTGGLRGMKSRQYEGGTRVPLIARWPGHIPAGHVNESPATMMDLFTTSLIAAGVRAPADRPIDGKDILGLLTSDAASPHEALYSFYGDRLCSVRDGDWKLHLCKDEEDERLTATRPWRDSRAPDGVTILAPREQYGPESYPGVTGGDVVHSTALFNLKDDPTEQHNVASFHPDVVERLNRLADRLKREMPPERPPPWERH